MGEFHDDGLENIIIKIAFSPKLIYRFNIIPSRIPTGFGAEIEKLILKFLWKLKETQNSHKKIEKEQNWRTDNSQFQTYCKTTIIKTVLY